MRDSLIIYRSFYEAIKTLSKNNQADVWNAIFEYSLNFKSVELTGISLSIFTLIKPQLDANIKRYKNGNEPKRKQQISKTEAKQKQTASKTEANDNYNYNVNDNLNLNLNSNVNVNKNVNKNHLFENSSFFDFDKFKDEILKDEKYSCFDLSYYHESIKNWSAEGNKKMNWIATAKNWMLRDLKQNSHKTITSNGKPQRIKSKREQGYDQLREEIIADAKRERGEL